MYGYVTLTSNEFVQGTVCLLKSLRRFTDIPFNVIDIDLADENRLLLENYGAIVRNFGRIGSTQAKTQPWHKNKDFANNCFNKLHIWNLVEYDKVIYLDSDMLVVKNIDHLFELDVEFAACPSYVNVYGKNKKLLNSNWSDNYFNAGFLLIEPHESVYGELLSLKDMFICNHDPSDQGFLNSYYKDNWHKLSSIYNATRRVFTAARDKWDEMSAEISVIHYTIEKPWLVSVEGCEEIEKLWWECYSS